MIPRYFYAALCLKGINRPIDNSWKAFRFSTVKKRDDWVAEAQSANGDDSAEPCSRTVALKIIGYKNPTCFSHMNIIEDCRTGAIHAVKA